MSFKQFGGKCTKDHEKRYSQSKNWDGKKFINLEETSMEFSFRNLPGLLKKQLFEKQGREPDNPIPIIPFDKEAFLAPSDKMKFIWYGHSVVLMRIKGKTILIDPMLGPNASPIAPFATKRFSQGSLELIDELPEIDLLIMTHDHYDHLDYDSIAKLKGKVKQYYTALGVGRHLESWGVDGNSIVEFDWWDQHLFNDVNITFTPSRHFSGRGLTDRAKSMWGGWVFKTDNENIYFSGDGGYGAHFKEVGEKLGPFDFGFIECGQYNENWHQIHMYPEEAIQASGDAKAQKVMPVHWAGFALALHTWTDPADRFVAAASKEDQTFISPQIGELVEDYNAHVSTNWWSKQ